MTITVDVVVKKYIELRDEVARIDAEAKERCNALKASMGKLDAWLRLKSEADGVESFKTQHGTAFYTTVDFAQVADWTAVLDYIITKEAWDMLEKRVAKTAIRAIVNETQVVPPGINYGTRKELNIRKPTKTD
jgi:hypothetical protein